MSRDGRDFAEPAAVSPLRKLTRRVLLGYLAVAGVWLLISRQLLFPVLPGMLHPVSPELVEDGLMVLVTAIALVWLLERGAHAVVAPLTGVFYRAPSPGAEPYLREGGQVNAGQVIGLIEAMKLFNEIKSDVTGTVKHIAFGDGELVKAREPLIEVDPA